MKFGYLIWLDKGVKERGTVEGVNNADHAKRLMVEVYKAHFNKIITEQQVDVTTKITSAQRRAADAGRAYCW